MEQKPKPAPEVKIDFALSAAMALNVMASVFRDGVIMIDARTGAQRIYGPMIPEKVVEESWRFAEQAAKARGAKLG